MATTAIFFLKPTVEWSPLGGVLWWRAKSTISYFRGPIISREGVHDRVRYIFCAGRFLEARQPKNIAPPPLPSLPLFAILLRREVSRWNWYVSSCGLSQRVESVTYIHGASAVRESCYWSSSSCQQALTFQELAMDASWGTGSRDAEVSMTFITLRGRYRVGVQSVQRASWGGGRPLGWVLWMGKG